MARKSRYTQHGINWDIAPWELRYHRPVFRSRQRFCGLSPRETVIAFLLFVAAVGCMAWYEGLLDRFIVRDYSEDDVSHFTHLSGRLLFILVVAGLMWRLILMVRVKYELALGAADVSFTVTFLGRIRAQWIEPLTNYDGVLFRVSECFPLARAVPELHHPEPEKCVLLCDVQMAADDPAGNRFRATWMGYARALNVPAIEDVPVQPH